MSFKQHIAKFLRIAGLMSIVDKGLYFLHRIKNRGGKSRFIKKEKTITLPPDYFLYETYRLKHKDYFEDGRQTASELLSLILRFGTLDACRLLDWGCGPGRVIRHLPGLLGAGNEIYGTDFNNDYIEWCKLNIPGVHFSVNNLQPPLPFQDNYFDIVLGLSIFTHLSKKNHFAWLNELHRVTNTGGILLVTTQGAHFRYKLLPKEVTDFESGKLVERRFVKEGHRLYSSFQPDAFMRQCLGDKWKVLKWLEGSDSPGSLMEQDVWVLQKSII